MSDHRSLSFFRDPKLTDRELMLLMLYEVARARADLLRVSRHLLQKVECDPERAATVAVESDREIFAEIEDDMRQFETRRQRPGQQ